MRRRRAGGIRPDRHLIYKHGSVSLDDLFSLPLALPSRQHPPAPHHRKWRYDEGGRTRGGRRSEFVPRAADRTPTRERHHKIAGVRPAQHPGLVRTPNSPHHRIASAMNDRVGPPGRTAWSVAVDAVAEIVRELVYDVLT